jgi:hypothetical protein
MVYKGTSLTRKRAPLGPYRRPMPRVLGGSYGVEFARTHDSESCVLQVMSFGFRTKAFGSRF